MEEVNKIIELKRKLSLVINNIKKIKSTIKSYKGGISELKKITKGLSPKRLEKIKRDIQKLKELLFQAKHDLKFNVKLKILGKKKIAVLTKGLSGELVKIKVKKKVTKKKGLKTSKGKKK